MRKRTTVFCRILSTLIICGSLAASFGCSYEEGAQKVGEVSKSEKAGSKEEKATEKTVFSVGDIVETKSMRISYLSSGEYKGYDEFSQPKDGNIIVFFEFEFENISDSDKLASALDFNCFADDNSCSEYMWSSDYLSATISSGRKAKGKVYYEVPKGAKEIELEYDSSWLSSEKVIFLYK